MTAETRRLEAEYVVFFESTRSRCSPTRSTSGGGRGTSPRESLRTYLDCLVREIEQLSSSSTTFSTSFSWRLPRGLYPYVARRCQSSSSTECAELELPMKVLDDLAVCRVRAKLRAQVVLQTGMTPAEARGKRTWTSLQGALNNIVNNKLSSAGGKVLASYIEKDVALTARVVDSSRMWNIVLRGRIDYIVLVSLKNRLFAMLFEVTEYRDAPETVKHRLLAYSSALYGELGFPVVPVLMILRDQEMVDDALVMKSRTLIPGVELRRAISKLMRVLSASEDTRPASSELCAVCDPSIRRMCQYTH